MTIWGSTLVLPVLCLSWTPPALFSWLSCPEYVQRTPCLSNQPLTSKSSIPTEDVKRVAIVGAGTSGLSALKTFLYDTPKPDGQRWEIELFEQRNDLGGLWLEDDGSARYPYLPQTPLYPSLHTNTPAPLMTFPDFPFPQYTPLFPSYHHVLAYHRNIASHFDLYPFIHFNHSLESAYWIGNSSTGFWELSISTSGPREEVIPLSGTSAEDLRHHSRITRHFDHLVVATGHYRYPKFPQWATNNAAAEWLRNAGDRTILHSTYFREPEEYADKVVLVVGAGASGRDMAALSGLHAKKVYHSFADHGEGPPWKVPHVVQKPRTKGFTPSSVQFEDDTEASDIDVVILATGYEYRLPFLDPSDPYHQPADDLSARERRTVVTTNSSAHSRSEEEPRLTENLNYLFPVDRHIVSLSPLHPLNALLFIGLQHRTLYATSDLAQSTFAGHLISHPDRVYPTSHLTGDERWNETLARELLLKNLTMLENRLADDGFNLYRLGHKMNLGWYTEEEYQDSLIAYLQCQGLVPRHDGYIHVKSWKARVRVKMFVLRKIWKEIESRGEEEVKRWLDGVETEDEWGDLMGRVLEWGKECGIV